MAKIIAGVYKLSFNGSNRIYIGSSYTLIRRRGQLFSEFDKNKFHIQEALELYIKSNYFIFDVLEYIHTDGRSKSEVKKELYEREQYYMDINTGYLLNKSKYALPMRDKSLRKNLKKVYQYNFDGVFIAEYKNSMEAEIATSEDSSSIRRCCSGQRFRTGNSMWSYERHDKIYPYTNPMSKTIIQLTMSGDFVKKYIDIKTACIETGFNIRKNKLQGDVFRGFIWVYDYVYYRFLETGFLEYNRHLKKETLNKII